MKTLAVLVLATAAAVGASAADFTGWISDATCGVGNAGSGKAERECAERCIKNGSAPVFITEGENKVYQVSDAELAKQHVAGKVKISGEIKGDKILIAKIVTVKE